MDSELVTFRLRLCCYSFDFVVKIEMIRFIMTLQRLIKNWQIKKLISINTAVAHF